MSPPKQKSHYCREDLCPESPTQGEPEGEKGLWEKVTKNWGDLDEKLKDKKIYVTAQPGGFGSGTVYWANWQIRKKFARLVLAHFSSDTLRVLKGLLFRALQNEVAELAWALEKEDPEEILEEAADVANFAMMVADIHQPEPTPKREGE